MNNKTECHQCARGAGLQLVPHRNKGGGIIGIVLVCEKCLSGIAGCEVETRIKEKAAESPPDRQATPVQQHYAEISALVSELEDTIANFGRPHKIVTQLKRAVQKLQQ